MLSVDEYRARVLDSVRPRDPARVPLAECLGLVLAEDVASAISLPSFDNSAMDGYAVRAVDVQNACAQRPCRLPVAGESAAGGDPIVLPPGHAAKVMTGAAIPAGADAVVPYEHTDHGSAEVSISLPPNVGAHIRRAGEDIAVGSVVARREQVLGPRQLSLLAATGQATPLVHRRPRVAVVTTGAELHQPGEALGPSGLYDSNGPLLAACVQRAGAQVTSVGRSSDDPHAFLALLDTLADNDLVVTSGGISMGDYDVVKAALAPRGVWFGPLAMQPGKPQGFGHVHPQTLLMAVPGNPVSTFVSFHQFVLPVLRRMMAIAPEASPSRPCVLRGSVISPAGRRQFLRGRLNDGHVELVGGTGSHLLGGLAEADCLIVIEEERERVEDGERVEVIDLEVF